MRLYEASILSVMRQVTYTTDWDKRFKELEADRQYHGDCNVPICWPDNPALQTGWTSKGKRKKGSLTEDRRQRLVLSDDHHVAHVFGGALRAACLRRVAQSGPTSQPTCAAQACQ